MHIERFAPSPTGYLHWGHAYSALLGYQRAQEAGGKWILRIEDIDFTRVKDEFCQAIYDDLHWLGLIWETPVLKQSTRMPLYQDALLKLQESGLVYGCQCTRKMLALSAPHGEEARYSGRCRERGLQEGAQNDALAWRLNIDKISMIYPEIVFEETGKSKLGLQKIKTKTLDDIVIARKDIGVSYHLAVVVDDAAQNISHVTRGEDLFAQTAYHVVLQKLLDLPTPIYHHHKLIRDHQGERMAKRKHSATIRDARLKGGEFLPEFLGIEQNLEKFYEYIMLR